MASLTIDPDVFEIVAIDELFGTYECHMNAAVTDRKGKIFYVNATNKAVLADASAAGTLSRIMGLAGKKEKMSIAGESVSLIRKAILYVGDILDTLDVGTPIYISDDVGQLATAASDATVDVIVGHVGAIEDASGNITKVLFFDTTRYAVA